MRHGQLVAPGAPRHVWRIIEALDERGLSSLESSHCVLWRRNPDRFTSHTVLYPNCVTSCTKALVTLVESRHPSPFAQTAVAAAVHRQWEVLTSHIGDCRHVPRAMAKICQGAKLLVLLDLPPGVQLSRVLASRQESPAIALSDTLVAENTAVAYLVLEAVLDIHSRGVYHGDLTMDNIYYDAATGTVKIIDFWKAVHADQAESHQVLMQQASDDRAAVACILSTLLASVPRPPASLQQRDAHHDLAVAAEDITRLGCHNSLLTARNRLHRHAVAAGLTQASDPTAPPRLATICEHPLSPAAAGPPQSAHISRGPRHHHPVTPPHKHPRVAPRCGPCPAPSDTARTADYDNMMRDLHAVSKAQPTVGANDTDDNTPNTQKLQRLLSAFRRPSSPPGGLPLLEPQISEALLQGGVSPDGEAVIIAQPRRTPKMLLRVIRCLRQLAPPAAHVPPVRRTAAYGPPLPHQLLATTSAPLSGHLSHPAGGIRTPLIPSADTPPAAPGPPSAAQPAHHLAHHHPCHASAAPPTIAPTPNVSAAPTKSQATAGDEPGGFCATADWQVATAAAAAAEGARLGKRRGGSEEDGHLENGGLIAAVRGGECSLQAGGSSGSGSCLETASSAAADGLGGSPASGARSGRVGSGRLPPPALGLLADGAEIKAAAAAAARVGSGAEGAGAAGPGARGGGVVEAWARLAGSGGLMAWLTCCRSPPQVREGC